MKVRSPCHGLTKAFLPRFAIFRPWTRNVIQMQDYPSAVSFLALGGKRLPAPVPFRGRCRRNYRWRRRPIGLVRIDYGHEVMEVYQGNAIADIHEHQLALLHTHWKVFIL
jgi:hypothetical protein